MLFVGGSLYCEMFFFQIVFHFFQMLYCLFYFYSFVYFYFIYVYYYFNSIFICIFFIFLFLFYVLLLFHVFHCFLFYMSFSRMRSKGSRFTLGVWGLECVRSTLRSRPQPSATVRNRSQPSARGPYGRAYGKFCRRDPFWRFQTFGCFVSRGRRGTSWHSDVFWNVSKVVLRGRRNTFATFFRRCVAVFVAGAALWTCPSSFFVAGAAL